MYATLMTQRNVLKATVPDRMVWLPKPACVIAAVRLSKALRDAHSKETSNLHVRAARFKNSCYSKKSIILTPCTSTQRNLENEQRKNYRILISSCWNTDIRLFGLCSKRGLGPDQSHYNQSWAQFCCKMWGDSWEWNRRSDVLCIPIPNLICRGVLRATLITLCPCRWCTYWYT